MFAPSQLLVKNPASRLGCCGGKFEDIKSKAFFQSINWPHLEAGMSDPPFVPDVGRLRDYYFRI